MLFDGLLHRGREYNVGVRRDILTRLFLPLARWSRAAGLGLGLALTALAGCTPQAALVTALLPDGTVPILLSQMQSVDEANRRRIVELEQGGDWDGLAKFAEDNLAKDRNSADWWIVAGYAYSRLGRHPRAIESYTEAVRLAPEDMLGWSLLAQSYRAAGQPGYAVRTLQRASLVGKETPTVFFLLGESYRDLRRDEAAIGAYREALRLDEAYGRAWLGMGLAYARLGRRDEVARIRKTLEGLDPALAQQLAEPQPAPQ